MQKDTENHIIGGIEFDDLVYSVIINAYSEAFTHSSLTIEKEFSKLKKYNNLLVSLQEDVEEEYEKQSDSEKEDIQKKYHYFITCMACYKQMIPPIDLDNQEIIDTTYLENFQEFDKFMTKLIVFDENGEMNFNETGKKISQFFPAYKEITPILETAKQSRLDHDEAFKFALSQKHMDIKEILKINEIINRSNPDRQIGFKKVNNTVNGASFETMKKEEIPNQIAELIYNYDNDFDLDIKDPYEDGITEEEEYKRLFSICLKEAIFHIKFEHIHPFADGNGRTGRIIMSSNLLKKNIAPPLITKVMLEQYKNFVNNCDYEGLAKMIMNSSSQLLSTWVTLKRENEGLSFEDIIDAKILTKKL